MGHIKDKLQSKISDGDYKPGNIPAIKAAIERLRENADARKTLLKSYPGILLLGDWHGAEINFDFFERIKRKFLDDNFNAYTLADIKQRCPTANDIEIQKVGIDEAQCVLLVDGERPGLVDEMAAIRQTLSWNNKCICFVNKRHGTDVDNLYKNRPHLKDLKNSLILFGGITELEEQLLFQGKSRAEVWVSEKIKENSLPGVEKQAEKD